MIFDFLPEEPTSPSTAAALLSGGNVRGKVRHRTMRRVPRRRCRDLGSAAVTDVRCLLPLWPKLSQRAEHEVGDSLIFGAGNESRHGIQYNLGHELEPLSERLPRPFAATRQAAA